MGNIQPGQVHQFKRPEFEADLVFQNPVDGGEIGNTFIDDAQRFGAITATGVVNNKTRCVLRLHRRVPHLPGVCGQVGADAGAGFEPGNDLDHLHQGNRVKEVKAGKLRWPFQLCRNGRYRQRRRVRGQYRGWTNQSLQFGEQTGLDVQPLHHGLHDQVAIDECGECVRTLQAGFVQDGLGCIQSTFCAQLVPLRKNSSLRRTRCVKLHVKQQHAAASLRGNLGDAPSHGASPYDADSGKNWFHAPDYDPAQSSIGALFPRRKARWRWPVFLRPAWRENQRRTCNDPGLTMLVGVPLMKLITLSKAAPKYIS